MAPDDRALLLDGLRPPSGFRLERAVGTTFTLDLETALENFHPASIVGAGGLATRHEAMEAGETEVDYVFFGDLDRLSSALAVEILKIAPGRQVVVGIHLHRRRETIVALLAVLRAGAAYLPLDPSYPSDRLRFMFEDSGAKLLLTRDRVSWAGDGYRWERA